MESNNSSHSSLSFNVWHHEFLDSVVPSSSSLSSQEFPFVNYSPSYSHVIGPVTPTQNSYHKSKPEPEYSLTKSPNSYGFLGLEGSPGPWIEYNTSASHLLVQRLTLSYTIIKDEEHVIEDSIDQLINLTHLTIYDANSLKCLPTSMSNLHNLIQLEFSCCIALPEKMGELNAMTSLTHIIFYQCNIKSLPEGIATLSTLTSLHLDHCYSLTELPATLGILKSFRHLSLINCHKLLSIPNILHLETLDIKGHCDSLITQFPVILGQLRNLKHFSLKFFIKLKFIPNTISDLINLESLSIKHCHFLTELPVSLGQLGSLKRLSLKYCSSLQSLPYSMTNLNLEFLSISNCNSLKELPDKLKVTYLKLGNSEIQIIPRGLINLQALSLIPDFTQFVQKFPDNLEGLHELILLDIKDTTIKYLPWSITELTKLRFLMLPSQFRLETLPSNLDDSVRISVQNSVQYKHIRKTWKELKQEIGVPDFPIAQAQYPSNISPPGYLQLEDDVEQWICNNYNSRMLVKMLDFVISYEDTDIERTENALGQFPNLTHFYFSFCKHKYCFLNTLKGLRHLSFKCDDIDFHSDYMAKLSNLESLDLICIYLPNNMDFPVTLRHLSIASCYTKSLPHTIAKLSNLITLELFECISLKSLPENLNVVRLKLYWIINPLPVSVRYLEIVHLCDTGVSGCDYDCSHLEICLTQLVNLETLSISSHYMTSLRVIGRLHNLQVLQLKDCFSLIELPSDLDELIGLTTLDISGTRIKSLPDCIMKLPNLKRVILPKCFKQESLPRDLQGFTIDDTDEIYYEHMKYYDPRFGTSPVTSDALGSDFEEKAGSVLEESQQGVGIGLSSDYCAIYPIPTGSQLNDRIDVSVNNQNSGCNSHIQFGQMRTVNSENDREIAPFNSNDLYPSDRCDVLENGENKNLQSDIEKGKTQKIIISREAVEHLMSKNMRLVDAAKQLQVSRSTLKRRLKELGITWPSSEKGKQNLDAKKRILNSETPSSQTMVNSSNKTDNDNMSEYEVEANQLPSPNHLSYAVDHLPLDPVPKNDKEIDMTPQFHEDDHQPIEQHLDS